MVWYTFHIEIVSRVTSFFISFNISWTQCTYNVHWEDKCLKSYNVLIFNNNRCMIYFSLDNLWCNLNHDLLYCIHIKTAFLCILLMLCSAVLKNDNVSQKVYMSEFRFNEHTYVRLFPTQKKMTKIVNVRSRKNLLPSFYD